MQTGGERGEDGQSRFTGGERGEGGSLSLQQATTLVEGVMGKEGTVADRW